jgi:hypothetical protein
MEKRITLSSLGTSITPKYVGRQRSTNWRVNYETPLPIYRDMNKNCDCPPGPPGPPGP